MSASSDTRTASSRLPRIGLIPQILIGIVAGLILASLAPSTAASFAILGDLFIGALKAVAPILVDDLHEAHVPFFFRENARCVCVANARSRYDRCGT